MTDAPKPDAWRYLSNAKGAKWTVQKNYPDQVAKWPGYTVEPLYSEAVLTSLREEVAELRKALEPFAEIGKQIGAVGPERTFSVIGLSVEADGINSHYRGVLKGGNFTRARTALKAQQ